MNYPVSNFTISPVRWIAGWICLLLIVPQTSWAAGALAGTSIINTATLSYSLSGVPQTDIPATSLAFMVDEKVNLTVTGGATTNVAPGSSLQVTAYTVTNNANSALDFSLAVTSVIAGDNFDPTACSVFVESGATAGYQAAQDTAIFIDELAADATRTVYAVCNIPGTAVDTNTGLVGLTATARGNFTGVNGVYAATPAALGAPITAAAGADTANVDIVFADVAGSEAGDGARDAKHSARNTYLVAIPVLSITKSVAGKLDPNGGTLVMPGAVLTYQIDVAVSGAGTVTSLVIDDPLPTDTTYEANTITVGGASRTDLVDGDNAQFAANTVTVTLGNVTAPANFVITFKAKIN